MCFELSEKKDRDMRTFRIAYTGDFLNPSGTSAYGEIGLSLLERESSIAYRFLEEQAPKRDDPNSLQKLYSWEMTPEQIADIDGLVVLRPWVTRSAFARGAKNLVVIGRS